MSRACTKPVSSDYSSFFSCFFLFVFFFSVLFFFQAEDGIRDLVRSRGLGDVYKRQAVGDAANTQQSIFEVEPRDVNRRTYERAIESVSRVTDEVEREILKAVSYTHLTLPTSDLV